MVNYDVDTYSVRGDIDSVLSGLKTKIETIDNGKTLRDVRIVPEGSVFRGIIIYDV